MRHSLLVNKFDKSELFLKTGACCFPFRHSALPHLKNVLFSFSELPPLSSLLYYIKMCCSIAVADFTFSVLNRQLSFKIFLIQCVSQSKIYYKTIIFCHNTFVTVFHNVLQCRTCLWYTLKTRHWLFCLLCCLYISKRSYTFDLLYYIVLYSIIWCSIWCSIWFIIWFSILFCIVMVHT